MMPSLVSGLLQPPALLGNGAAPNAKTRPPAGDGELEALLGHGTPSAESAPLIRAMAAFGEEESVGSSGSRSLQAASRAHSEPTSISITFGPAQVNDASTTTRRYVMGRQRAAFPLLG